MKDREKLTLDELQKQVEWHDSVGAGLELLRRLREVVPLLEEIQAARWNPTIAEMIALVQGTAESATGGETQG